MPEISRFFGIVCLTRRRRKLIDETYNVCDSIRHEYKVNAPHG